VKYIFPYVCFCSLIVKNQFMELKFQQITQRIKKKMSLKKQNVYYF